MVLDFSTTNAQVTDEIINVSDSNPVGLVHDIFYNKTGKLVVISTAAGGGGTVLTETTDYTLGGAFPDADFPTSISPDVGYTTVSITNATYHSTDLYVAYYPIMDLVDAEIWNESVVKTETKLVKITDNYTVTAGAKYHIIDATLTTVDKTLTLPAASAIEGELYRVVLSSTTSAKLSFPVGTFKWKGKTIDPTLYEDGETIEFISDGTNLIVTRFDFDRKYFLEDQKSSGTQGGALLAGWQTRTLNTEVGGQPNWIATALSGNQASLPPGVYKLFARSPVFSRGCLVAVYNASDAVYAVTGSSEFASTSGHAVVQSEAIIYDYEITGIKLLEVHVYATGGLATNGLGVAVASGQVEKYTRFEIEQVIPL